MPNVLHFVCVYTVYDLLRSEAELVFANLFYKAVRIFGLYSESKRPKLEECRQHKGEWTTVHAWFLLMLISD